MECVILFRSAKTDDEVCYFDYELESDNYYDGEETKELTEFIEIMMKKTIAAINNNDHDTNSMHYNSYSKSLAVPLLKFIKLNSKREGYLIIYKLYTNVLNIYVCVSCFYWLAHIEHRYDEITFHLQLPIYSLFNKKNYRSNF